MMNKGHLFILTIIIVLSGIVFYFTQSNSLLPQTALPINTTPTPNLSQFPLQISPIQKDQKQTQQDQQKQLQAAIEQIKKASITAVIKTSKGDITMKLYGKDAPITVLNFVQKSQANLYNNLTFHRVEDWVVQGGDPKGDGAGGGDLPTEFNERPYEIGSVGAARRNDPQIQNDSQFFITKTASPHLNEQYTNFGTVTQGIDVVGKIEVGDKILGITITGV